MNVPVGDFEDHEHAKVSMLYDDPRQPLSKVLFFALPSYQIVV
jgi:hypothetical protein